MFFSNSGLASKIPDEETIRQGVLASAKDILKGMAADSHGGLHGEKYRQLVTAAVEVEGAKGEGLSPWSPLIDRLSDIIVHGVTGVDIKKRSITFAPSCRKFLIEHLN